MARQSACYFDVILVGVLNFRRRLAMQPTIAVPSNAIEPGSGVKTGGSTLADTELSAGAMGNHTEKSPWSVGIGGPGCEHPVANVQNGLNPSA